MTEISKDQKKKGKGDEALDRMERRKFQLLRNGILVSLVLVVVIYLTWDKKTDEDTVKSDMVKAFEENQRRVQRLRDTCRKLTK